jgi:hypothetical protein
VRLDDGSLRLSLVSSSEDNSTTLPDCIQSAAALIAEAFDEVEAGLVAVLTDLVGGNNDSLTVLEARRPLGLTQLPTKTHLHVYLRPEEMDEEAEEEDNEVGRYGSVPSLPYHVDHGLYLLVTPSASLPLRLKSRRGKMVSTESVAPDTVLVLLGRGLTHWLLQGSERLTPALHAVPSLVQMGVPARTVVARMKVAPSAARPLSQPTAGDFSEAFFGEDGTAAARSPISLCEFGSPLTEADSRLARQRRRAECWPHTGEGCGPRKWNGRACRDSDKVDAGRGAGSCDNDNGCPACAPFCSRSGYCQNHR